MALPEGPAAPVPIQALQWGFLPVRYLFRARRNYGDTFTMRFAAGDPIVSFSHPYALRDIFKASPDVLLGGAANEVLEPVFGRGSLLLLDGEEHQLHRRLVVPPFYGDDLERCAEEILEVTHSQVDTWVRGQRFRLLAQLEEISFRVIFRMTFGSDDPAMRRNLSLGLAALDPGFYRAFVFLARRLPPFGPLDPRVRFSRARKALRDLMVTAVERSVAEGLPPRGLLRRLVEGREATGERLSIDVVVDELITAVVSTRVSVAISLAWTFELLFQAGDAMRTAVTAALSGDRGYLTSLLQESLRLHPVLPLAMRRLAGPATLGGVRLPRGTAVAANIFLAHLREDSFERPLAFTPGRFLDTPPSRYAWLPFGGGARRCAGAGLAMLEMRLIIEVILRRADLRPLDRPATVAKHGFSFAPRGDVPVVVTAVRQGRGGS